MSKLPKIFLTNHAKMRMVDRLVDFDHIKQAIVKPDGVLSSFLGKIKVIKKLGNRIIVVVYSDYKFKNRENEYLIISFYYIDE